MNLEQLFKETDALTYANSIKVLLTQLKDEQSEAEEMLDYGTQALERSRKLIRKVDNQYRLISKIIQKDTPTISDITIDENVEELEELEKIMEQQ